MSSKDVAGARLELTGARRSISVGGSAGGVGMRRDGPIDAPSTIAMVKTPAAMPPGRGGLATIELVRELAPDLPVVLCSVSSGDSGQDLRTLSPDYS